MAYLRTTDKYNNIRIYKCDVCGKEEKWNKNWEWYGSYAHSDTCPKDVPTVCSVQCRIVLDEKIRNKEIELPKLSKKDNSIFYEKTSRRKGY